MGEVAIWKYVTYIHQKRMTQNVNNSKALPLTKQAGALFVSGIWKHTYDKQGLVGFKISFQ